MSNLIPDNEVNVKRKNHQIQYLNNKAQPLFYSSRKGYVSESRLEDCRSMVRRGIIGTDKYWPYWAVEADAYKRTHVWLPARTPENEAALRAWAAVLNGDGSGASPCNCLVNQYWRAMFGSLDLGTNAEGEVINRAVTIRDFSLSQTKVVRPVGLATTHWTGSTKDPKSGVFYKTDTLYLIEKKRGIECVNPKRGMLIRHYIDLMTCADRIAYDLTQLGSADYLPYRLFCVVGPGHINMINDPEILKIYHHQANADHPAYLYTHDDLSFTQKRLGRNAIKCCAASHYNYLATAFTTLGNNGGWGKRHWHPWLCRKWKLERISGSTSWNLTGYGSNGYDVAPGKLITYMLPSSIVARLKSAFVSKEKSLLSKALQRVLVETPGHFTDDAGYLHEWEMRTLALIISGAHPLFKDSFSSADQVLITYRYRPADESQVTNLFSIEYFAL